MYQLFKSKTIKKDKRYKYVAKSFLLDDELISAHPYKKTDYF